MPNSSTSWTGYGDLWRIVGGEDKGGVLVREGPELSSAKLPERMSTGALVKAVGRTVSEAAGERLQVERITGTGPDTGWISVALNHKKLMEPLNCEQGKLSPNSEAAVNKKELHVSCVMHSEEKSESANKAVEEVEDENKEDVEVRPVRFCIAGTWNDWVATDEMEWDERRNMYKYDMQPINPQGWESFQILQNGDYAWTLHPDCADGSPYKQHELCGPDDKGHGLNWSPGMETQDHVGVDKDARYRIRLFLKSDGSGVPAKVDWVRDRLSVSAGLLEPEKTVAQREEEDETYLEVFESGGQHVARFERPEEDVLREARLALEEPLYDATKHIHGAFCGINDLDLFKALLEELSIVGRFSPPGWNRIGQRWSAEPEPGSVALAFVVGMLVKMFDVEEHVWWANLYEDASSGCDYHDDGHQKRFNITVSASFGYSRDLTFQHTYTGVEFPFMQDNGDVFAFSDWVDNSFKHRVYPLHKSFGQVGPRISVVIMGKTRIWSEPRWKLAMKHRKILQEYWQMLIKNSLAEIDRNKEEILQLQVAIEQLADQYQREWTSYINEEWPGMPMPDGLDSSMHVVDITLKKQSAALAKQREIISKAHSPEKTARQETLEVVSTIKCPATRRYMKAVLGQQ
eukprot:gnl/TRDRNA2_/TRDRNA2_202625_c0_seq1.p1 gnl/TRDRNA2_/TRDRNA2_202625_c0~~gnl/TRDRNA2_/TRDRNA2_202625_c0_seq1.p1  ORF type:complete len:631 (-),score=127.41 gnl/TRDRNA2_/TRDRNA2_202625_c0_seq1:62-1954(-)